MSKILITNDDGIHAPGIKHLWDALEGKGERFVVAPAYEQSGVGAGISIGSSFKVEEKVWDMHPLTWSVTGTPADCVKMAVNVLLSEKPDLIVSGINRGTNAGRNVLYSGTIGGVIEGVLRGIPGIAFSLFDYDHENYALFERYVPSIADYVFQHPLPAGTMLNVNFPSLDLRRRKDRDTVIRGIVLTRQGKQYWLEHPEQIFYDPATKSYRFGIEPLEFEEHEESDIYWLERGYITVVPVHVEELTDWRYLHTQKVHFEDFIKRLG